MSGKKKRFTALFFLGAAIASISCGNGLVDVESLPDAEPEYADHVTQYGITWTFDGPRATGRFATGDYWVVGPVSIVDIHPGPEEVPIEGGIRTINGSMLNPEMNDLQGYDSWMLGSAGRSWDASLNAARPGGQALSAANPLVIETGSLISAISYPETGEGRNVRVMAVLTALAEVPPEGAFRPPYVGKDKTVRHALAQADFGCLPHRPALSAFGQVSALLDDSLAAFEKPWIEHMHSWQKELFCAPDNMPWYGREYAGAIGQAACLLTLNIDNEKKESLAARLIQVGLDNYGILRVPGGSTTWAANGGHMSGRSFPLVFAGYLLKDQEMLGVMGKTGDYAYGNGHHEGNLPPDYVHFGELDQTFFVTLRDVERTAHGVTRWIWEPDERSAAVPYSLEDVGEPEWGIEHAHSPSGDNANPDAIYRQTCSCTWAGMALAARMMGIKDKWNHPAFFDYVDAWMDRRDDASGTFIPAMWNTYRIQY